MVLKKKTNKRDLSFKHCQAVKMYALRQQKLFIAIYIFPMFICTYVCAYVHTCVPFSKVSLILILFSLGPYTLSFFSDVLQDTKSGNTKKIRETKKYLCLPVTLINEAQYNYANQVVYGNHLLLHGAIMWKKKICSLILLVAYSEEQRMVSYYLPE